MPLKPGQSVNDVRLLTSLGVNLLPIVPSTSVGSITPSPATIVYS